MTTITEYQCDICKGRYFSSEEAIQCEQKGEFDPAQFPIGFMFPYHHNGYVGILVFAEVISFVRDRHLGTVSYLAFRVKNGDSTYENGLCGQGNFIKNGDIYHPQYTMSDQYLERPEFLRAYNYLQRSGIQPTYMSDGNLVKAFVKPTLSKIFVNGFEFWLDVKNEVLYNTDSPTEALDGKSIWSQHITDSERNQILTYIENLR